MKMLRAGSLLLVAWILLGAVVGCGKSTAPSGTPQTLPPGRIPQPSR
jgi:hypothetical protein